MLDFTYLNSVSDHNYLESRLLIAKWTSDGLMHSRTVYDAGWSRAGFLFKKSPEREFSKLKVFSHYNKK